MKIWLHKSKLMLFISHNYWYRKIFFILVFLFDFFVYFQSLLCKNRLLNLLKKKRVKKSFPLIQIFSEFKLWINERFDAHPRFVNCARFNGLGSPQLTGSIQWKLINIPFLSKGGEFVGRLIDHLLAISLVIYIDSTLLIVEVMYKIRSIKSCLMLLKCYFFRYKF